MSSKRGKKKISNEWTQHNKLDVILDKNFTAFKKILLQNLWKLCVFFSMCIMEQCTVRIFVFHYFNLTYKVSLKSRNSFDVCQYLFYMKVDVVLSFKSPISTTQYHEQKYCCAAPPKSHSLRNRVDTIFGVHSKSGRTSATPTNRFIAN